jgi:tetratricopeptide (TPR) repeat protein
MTVEDLYKKACDAVERANYDYAIELFREVLRQNPEYPDARLALRGTERRRLQEKGGSALGMLTRPVSISLTGLKSLVSGAKKKLELWEDFLQKQPDSFWGLTRAGSAARKLGLRGEAINIYKDAQRLKASHKGTLRALGNLLVEDGQHQEALKYLSRLSEIDPSNRELLREVRDLAATEHMVSHEMEGATSFRDLIRDKDEAERLESAGRMAVTMDDLRGRVGQAERELAEHPDNVTRILGLAKLYRDTGHLAKAQQLLREKHRAMPDNYEIRAHLGDTQLAVYDEAAKGLKARLQQEPADTPAKRKLAELEQRRRDLAVREYKWRLHQHPTERELHLRLGYIHLDAGEANEAIAAFQSASQDARYEAEACKMLGVCFMHKGQHDLAIEQFEKAVKSHPELDEQGKDLRYQEAAAYEQMGNKGQALSIYKKVYSTDINFRDVAQKVETLSRAGRS